MTSIINKLLGKDHDNEHAHKTETKCESGSCSTTVAAAHKQGAVKTSECDSASCSRNTDKESETHAVQRDGVNIKSTISTEGNSTVSLANQQKLVDLVSKLGSTYSQIDDYAKNQTEKINEEIQREIDEVVGRTRREQEELLRKAQAHTDDIDKEYRARLQLMVEEVDAAKAKRISEVEVELNNQQTGILQAARNEIDALNKKAARLKIGVLEAAEAKVAADARNISAQPLDKASTVHVATGTTTIKTEVVAAANTTVAGSGSSSSAAAGEVHVATGGAKHVSETKTVETKHQSHETKK